MSTIFVLFLYNVLANNDC